VKITDVEAIILRQPALDDAIADGSQDDLVVRVHTDAGLVGIGEVDSAPEVVRAAIEAPDSHVIAMGLKGLLLGENPLDVERLWHKMYAGAVYYARRGVGMHAISGLDLALWDLRGKALGRPVCELLGTPRRDRVRAYASTLMPEQPEAVRASVRDWVARGFTAVKLGWGPLGRDPDHDVRLVQAAREAAGDRVDLIIDAGLGYGADVAAARRVARVCEELNVFCLEEPFGPDELEAYAELADSMRVPVSTGEQLSTVGEFRELIERGHVDIIQPDVTRCGGLTELLRIADLAQSRGVTLIPHAWKSGVIKAASLHALAVLPEAPFLEYAVARTPLNLRLTRQTFPLQDGFVAVPTSPGLGADLDPEILERYRVAPSPS
jgi:L-alanine-DL-glutamate epimerase-like enolase superfamily enzyme